jgi:trimethylamine---corrinoid protein Co-methyltransferase
VQLTLLSKDEIEQIHQTTLRVLEEIGIAVRNERALRVLSVNGFEIIGSSNVVRFPRTEVEKTVRCFSGGIDIYDRAGHPALHLGKGKVYFGPGGGATNILDLEGNRRPSTKADVEKVAKICDFLRNMDFVMSDITAQDMPLKTQDLHELEAMILNTTKPLVPVCLADGHFVETVYKIHQVVRPGDVDIERPFIILYFQPSSPLQLDTDPLGRLMKAAELNVPIIVSGAMSAGGTGPVTIAGAVVTANAEALAAMTIARLVNQRARIIYGLGGVAMDLHTGNFCYGSPELGFLSGVAVGELAEFYDFATWGRGACSDAKALDAQFGSEVFMNSILPALGGVNLIHDAGRVDFGKSGCFEALVMADEIVDACRRVIRGYRVDDEKLAFGAIKEVGIGGTFLSSRHTLKHYKEELWEPKLFTRLDYQSWSRSEQREIGRRAQESVRKILCDHRPKELDRAVQDEIHRIVMESERAVIGMS